MSIENEQDKSVVGSYRLKADTKEKLKQQLDQLGLTQEQYFSKITTMMELEMVKKTNIFAVNTDELDELTKRIYNIFINMCEQGNTFLSSKDKELEELKNKYKDMLLNKDNKITELRQELQDTSSKLETIQNENGHIRLELADNKLKHKKQLEQLDNNLKDKTLIVEEYKEKNDMLLSELQKYKEYKNINKQLTEQLEQYQNDNRTLLTNTINLENKITRLQGEIDNNAKMITFYEGEIENKNNSINEYKDDIKALEIKKDKEIENIKVDHKKALDNQLKDITDKLNNKYELTIANKNSEIEKLKREIEKLKLRKFKVTRKHEDNNTDYPL